MSFNIALIEPQIPQNTGNIARTCAATGCRLHLVEPLGFAVDDVKLKRAGLDYWHLLDITYYANLSEFLNINSAARMFFCTTKAFRPHSLPNYQRDDFLVFGKETAGLPRELLAAHPQQCIRIPMISDARSLNLSNSVAIVAYEALRQIDYFRLK